MIAYVNLPTWLVVLILVCLIYTLIPDTLPTIAMSIADSKAILAHTIGR